MQKVAVIGLGNPGARFAGTRHNFGIEVVRMWVVQAVQAGHLIDYRDWHSDTASNTEVALGMWSNAPTPTRVWAVFPQTFMNASGEAVQAFLQQQHIAAAGLLVVHDDLEVPFGDVQVLQTGSAKGHNGVRSIQTTLATQAVARVRLGIGRPSDQTPIDQFVLERFSTTEQTALAPIQAQAVATVQTYLTTLLERAVV